MSGRGSRRQRRQEDRNKQKELLRQDESKNENPSSSFAKRIFNGKVLKYTIAATLALAGSELAREQLKSTTPSKPDYSLELVLLAHDGRGNALNLINEMDRAIQNGEPFKIMFTESAGQTASNFEIYDHINGEFSIEIKNKYNALQKLGYTPKQAEALLQKSDLPKMDRFSAIVFIGAAIRDIKMLPIESYTESEAEKQLKDIKRGSELVREKKNVLYKSNPTLKELMLVQKEEESILIDDDISRNHEVSNGIVKRFDDALKRFPYLRSEQSKGRPLRAIGWMGYAHSPIFYELDHSNKKISIEIKKYHDYRFPITERIIDEMTYKRELTEREAYLIAIEKRYIVPTIQQLSAQGIDNPINQSVIDGLMGLTQAQLEDLDEKSSKISDPKLRTQFILKQLLK